MTSLLMRRAAMMRHRQEAALPYLCFTAVDATDIAWSTVGTLTKGQAIEYSTDGATWSAYTFGTPISLAADEKCRFRGDNASFGESMYVYIHFSSTGRVKASGNMMSLVDKTCTQTTISTLSMFAYAFEGCTTLLTAPELPATTVAGNSYRYMFKGCTALTEAPFLPATTTALYSYSEMFNGCTNLSVIRVGLQAWRNTNDTKDWVKNVSPTGTFYCPRSLNTSTPGTGKNPSGWTIISTD